MDLQPYVDAVRHELNVTAAAAGDAAQDLADRLSASLESAIRLALLEALSAAAEEITGELAPRSVEVRLRGRDPEFIVSAPLDEDPDIWRTRTKFSSPSTTTTAAPGGSPSGFRRDCAPPLRRPPAVTARR